MTGNDNTSVSESRNSVNSNNNQEPEMMTLADDRESAHGQQSGIDTSTTTDRGKLRNNTAETVATREHAQAEFDGAGDDMQQNKGTLENGATNDATNAVPASQDEEFIEVQLSDGQPKPTEGTRSSSVLIYNTNQLSR
jgi:hypothetical protein